MNQNTIKTDDEKEIDRMSNSIRDEAMLTLEKDCYVDLSEEIPPAPIAISCGTHFELNVKGERQEYNTPLSTDGNFSFIQAFPKAGKTFFISLLVSAYQGGRNKFTGKLRGNRKQRIIIHFDTEQSKRDCQKVFRRTMVMNGIQEDVNYHTYYLRSMSYSERIEFIEYILYVKFNKENIGLVIIDGVADLVSDVNDMASANYCVQKLMEWTSVLVCHIITVIHQNYGTAKATGNLGSALEKKAETQISLEKNEINKGWVSIECKRSRNRGFKPFSFLINENGLPEFVDNDYDF